MSKGKDLVRCEDYILKSSLCFSKAIEVSQMPIGKTPRSTPATYLGVWTRIRDLIAMLPNKSERTNIQRLFL